MGLILALVRIPYWWHATLFEVLWLAAGLIGSVITAVNLWDSIHDRPVIDQIRRDPSVHERHWRMIELAARGREHSQWSRLAICLMITGSGIFGVLQANPLKGGTTWTGFVVTLTLLAIAGLTAGKSVMDYRQQKLMYQLGLGRTSVTAARLRARVEKDSNL